MNFMITRRRRLQDFYSIGVESNQPVITRHPDSEFLSRTGVYLIFDRRLGNVSEKHDLTDLIYVGLAGAKGINSTFDARIPKHIKKALGFHADHPDFPQAGISDTALWAQYRETMLNSTLEDNVDKLNSSWDIQLMGISNSSESERNFIALLEKVVGLIYAVSKADLGQTLQQPPCNSASLLGPLLTIFAKDTESADKTVISHVEPQATAMSTSGFEVLTRDNDELDAEFFTLLSKPAQRIYSTYVTAAQEAFQRPDLRALGLYFHYTNTNGRDMRIAGCFPKHPQQKNCMRVIWRNKLNAFDVYSRIKPTEIMSWANHHQVTTEVSSVVDNLSTMTRLKIDSGDVVGVLVRMTCAAGGFE